MRSSNSLASALVLLALVVAAPAVPGEQLEGTTSELLHRAITRTERDFVRWAGLLEEGARRGIPVAVPPDRRAEDFLETLASIRRELGPEDGSLAAKVRHVERRIERWRQPIEGPAGRRSVLDPFPAPDPAKRSVLLTADECGGAQEVPSVRGGWRTSGSNRETRWLRLVAPRTGGYRVHTGGSQTDTVLSVFKQCEGDRIATNDDDWGLLSDATVWMEQGQTVLVQVTALGGRPRVPVSVTADFVGSGSIAGRVTAAASGLPVVGTRVSFYGPSGGFMGSDFTDSDGMFLEFLPPGNYFAATSETEDLVDEVWDDITCELSCDPTVGTPIAVASGPVEGIDLALSAGGTISGRLRDALTGEALAGQRVELFITGNQQVGSVSADGAGRYEFRGLAEATYFVATDVFSDYRDEIWDDIPCDFGCDADSGDPIVLTGGASVEGVDFELLPLETMSGLLRDEVTKEPIQGLVRIYAQDGNFVSSVLSNAQGTWESSGLLPGNYRAATDLFSGYRNEVWNDVECGNFCDPLAGDLIPVAPGRPASGIDFHLRPLGSLGGRVTDATTAHALRSHRVEVWTEDGFFVDSDRTDSAGVYEVADLGPGTYHAVTNEQDTYIDELYDDLACGGGPPTGCDPTSGTPLRINENAVLDVDFQLALGGAIAGEIREEWTGDLILGGLVSVWDSRGVLWSTDDVDEPFRFEGLPTGSYTVTVKVDTHLGELWDDMPCEPSCDPTQGDPIQVVAGGMTRGIDFDLTLIGGVAGTVVDEGATPIAGVGVDIWDAGGSLRGSTATNTEGRYQYRLTTSGIYFVSTDNGFGLPDELFDDILCAGGPAIGGGCDPTTGTPIPVVAADPVLTGIDFELGPTIFTDGFESGDTSAWDSSAGE